MDGEALDYAASKLRELFIGGIEPDTEIFF